MNAAEAYAADCELAYRLAPLLALWNAEAKRARRRKARLQREALEQARAAEREAWEAYQAIPPRLAFSFDAAREVWAIAEARVDEIKAAMRGERSEM